MTQFKALKPKKTSDYAVEAIWELIHTGELKPGDKLPPERELAKRFEISMTSLREALQKLESYGHITKKRGQGGGSIILDVSDNVELELTAQKLMLKNFTVEDINQASIQLFTPIYETAMEKISENQIAGLKDLAKRQKEEFEIHGGSVIGWKFLTEIAKITENPILMTVTELIMLLLMQKEFSLGIDDIGSSHEVKMYNKKATEYSDCVIQALEKKNLNAIRKAHIKMAEALNTFESNKTDPGL